MDPPSSPPHRMSSDSASSSSLDDRRRSLLSYLDRLKHEFNIDSVVVPSVTSPNPYPSPMSPSHLPLSDSESLHDDRMREFNRELRNLQIFKEKKPSKKDPKKKTRGETPSIPSSILDPSFPSSPSSSSSSPPPPPIPHNRFSSPTFFTELPDWQYDEDSDQTDPNTFLMAIPGQDDTETLPPQYPQEAFVPSAEVAERLDLLNSLLETFADHRGEHKVLKGKYAIRWKNPKDKPKHHDINNNSSMRGKETHENPNTTHIQPPELPSIEDRKRLLMGFLGTSSSPSSSSSSSSLALASDPSSQADLIRLKSRLKNVLLSLDKGDTDEDKEKGKERDSRSLKEFPLMDFTRVRQNLQTGGNSHVVNSIRDVFNHKAPTSTLDGADWGRVALDSARPQSSGPPAPSNLAHSSSSSTSGPRSLASYAALLEEFKADLNSPTKKGSLEADDDDGDEDSKDSNGRSLRWAQEIEQEARAVLEDEDDENDGNLSSLTSIPDPEEYESRKKKSHVPIGMATSAQPSLSESFAFMSQVSSSSSSPRARLQQFLDKAKSDMLSDGSKLDKVEKRRMLPAIHYKKAKEEEEGQHKTHPHFQKPTQASMDSASSSSSSMGSPNPNRLPSVGR